MSGRHYIYQKKIIFSLGIVFHNPQTHNFNAGREEKIDNIKKISLALCFIGAFIAVTNGKLDLDGRGYLVSEDGTTKVPGVFVAGDSRTKKYAQITIAVADGTIAALDAINYLNK